MKKKPIVITFGRFNPPHIGHEVSINYAINIAEKNKADLAIIPSKTQDNDKNPLSFDRKLYWLNKMFPRYKKYFDKNAHINTPIKALKYYNDLGYQHVIFITGEDRLKEYELLLYKYNGKEYNYSTIDVQSSGNRKSGISGTDVRRAVKNSDYNTFEKLLSNRLNAIEKQELYNELKEILK